MKKLLFYFLSATILLVAGCSESFDDSQIWTKLDSLESRIAALEQLCRHMNTNISSLQTLVNALKNNDYVTGVTPITEDGKTVGYTITFSKSSPVTIYHGKDGANGADGKDGVDGKDGADGYTPIIGVKQDVDGIYYWTLDGEWLLDNNGNKIKAEGKDGKDGQDGKDGADGADGKDGEDGVDGKDGEDGKDGKDGKDGADGADGEDGKDGIDGKDGADGKDGIDGTDGEDGKDGVDGKDGITPQLKIENEYWYISYDNGATWTELGKATGDDGQDGTDGKDGQNGDSMFQSVTQDEDYVYLILSTGVQINIPKYRPLSVTFTETEDIRVLADKTYKIGYTITGADDKTVIKALAQDGFRAVVKKTDNATGVIEITTPSTILPTEILVFVTDGKERTIMRSINFVEGVIIVSSKSYTVDYAGGTVQVPLSTNIDYTVEIPEADKSWISVAETRAVMRDETLTFTVAKNETLTARYSMVNLIDALGVTSETILISQRAGAMQSIQVATAGTLESLVGTNNKDLVEELTVTGSLNFVDFEFIKTMSNLQLLDLSGLDNTTLPASCLEGTTIPTVLLPWNLTAIPNRAFYQSSITSIYIPETVQTIGEYAFYQCKLIKGDLVIPDAITSIGNYCFYSCSFDRALTIGNGLQSIGENAFAFCSMLTGDLVIPDSVTTIGKYAFYKCSGFTGNLIIGNGVVGIGNNAFENCSGLSGNIVLGNQIATIGVSAFEGCSALTGNLVIPDSVTQLEYNVFLNCTNLQGYLLIGAGLTELPYGAFAALKDGSKSYTPLNFSAIYCKPSQLALAYRPKSMAGTERRYEGLAFGSTYNWPNCMVYVPTGCRNTYIKQSYKDESWSTIIYPWEEFAGIEEIEF